MANVHEQFGHMLLTLMEERQGNFPHLRMRSARSSDSAKPEEVPPFPHVHRHHHFGLDASGQNIPCVFGRFSDVQKVEIGFLCRFAGFFPYMIRRAVLAEESGSITVISFPKSSFA